VGHLTPAVLVTPAVLSDDHEPGTG